MGMISEWSYKGDEWPIIRHGWVFGPFEELRDPDLENAYQSEYFFSAAVKISRSRLRKTARCGGADLGRMAMVGQLHALPSDQRQLAWRPDRRQLDHLRRSDPALSVDPAAAYTSGYPSPERRALWSLVRRSSGWSKRHPVPRRYPWSRSPACLRSSGGTARVHRL